MPKTALQPVTLEQAQHFERWGQNVSGWWRSPHELGERPGVYVVATHGFQLPFVLDVGEAENVRAAVLAHARRVAWRRGALGNLLYAVVYTPKSESAFLDEFHRRTLEHRIRQSEEPMFGAHEAAETALEHV